MPHRPGGLATEIAVGVAIGAGNVGLHRLIPKHAQLPVSIAGAALFAAGGRLSGASLTELGLAPNDLGRGVRVGLLGAVPVAAAIGVAAAIPALRRHFHDDRVRRVDAKRALREIGILIPFQTAVPEEVVFRGVLLGVLLRHRSPLVAIGVSSVVFGLWHVLPTLGTMGDNATTAALAERPSHRAGVVVTSVALTTAAGAGFALLRLASSSVAAPAVTHALTNGLAFAAAYGITRRAAALATPPAAPALPASLGE